MQALLNFLLEPGRVAITYLLTLAVFVRIRCSKSEKTDDGLNAPARDVTEGRPAAKRINFTVNSVLMELVKQRQEFFIIPNHHCQEN